MQAPINPILPGTYPDPTIVAHDGTYWLVASTFEYFPGLPVFRSTDLATWTQVGHAIDRIDQLDLSTVASSQGLFAPTLRTHDGTWYLICTLVGGDGLQGNFVITATDPAGPWSDPIWIAEAPGIDPSLFFDDDGRVWYTGTHLVDDGAWEGQTAVWLQELDRETLQLIGERTVLWNGALLGAVWAEGPHLYRKDGWYFLLASEGGTAFHHALSVARSRTIDGPYEGSRANPVLTHRHLGQAHPIANVGHADLFPTADGGWAAVLLASRPYGGHFANLGRETFLVDVVWEDDWPVFAPGVGVVTGHPQLGTEGRTMPDALQWTQAGTGRCAFWTVDPDCRTVTIDAPPPGAGPGSRDGFVGVRQRHRDAAFGGTIAGSSAGGLLIRQSDDAWIAALLEDGVIRVTVSDGSPAEVAEVDSLSIASATHVELDVRTEGQSYSIGVSSDGKRSVVATVDGRFLSSQRAGGFLGVWLGFAASARPSARPSSGTASRHSVAFTDVFYEGMAD